MVSFVRDGELRSHQDSLVQTICKRTTRSSAAQGGTKPGQHGTRRHQTEQAARGHRSHNPEVAGSIQPAQQSRSEVVPEGTPSPFLAGYDALRELRMRDLPTGTITFLFTDIEGSTQLLQELGEAYAGVQDAHATILRKAISEGDGSEIRTEGDSFFAVFPTALGGLRAAVAAQRGLQSQDWSHGGTLWVRVGLHTGEGRLGGDKYLGVRGNPGARLPPAGDGGEGVPSDAPPAL